MIKDLIGKMNQMREGVVAQFKVVKDTTKGLIDVEKAERGLIVKAISDKVKELD